MVKQFSNDAVTMAIFFTYILPCIASLIVNIPAKQIETNVCGKYWIAKILRNLVNDAQFDKFPQQYL